MRAPRLRIRSMMLAVAAVALIAWAAVHVERSRQWVGGHRQAARYHRIHAGVFSGPGARAGLKPSPAAAELIRRHTAYHNAMAAKYEWAARYPWLPLWPDPPEPL